MIYTVKPPPGPVGASCAGRHPTEDVASTFAGELGQHLWVPGLSAKGAQFELTEAQLVRQPVD